MFNFRSVKAKDSATALQALEGVRGKLQLALRLLSNEDDDVSAGVSTFLHDYLTTLKQLGSLDAEQKQFVLVGQPLQYSF